MNDSLRAQCIAEFLGTGLFLFFGIGCLSALKVAGASLGLWEICIIWGLGISLAVYLTAGISGAHLNPAITIALWLFACFPGRFMVGQSVLHWLCGRADAVCPSAHAGSGGLYGGQAVRRADLDFHSMLRSSAGVFKAKTC